MLFSECSTTGMITFILLLILRTLRAVPIDVFCFWFIFSDGNKSDENKIFRKKINDTGKECFSPLTLKLKFQTFVYLDLDI